MKKKKIFLIRILFIAFNPFPAYQLPIKGLFGVIFSFFIIQFNRTNILQANIGDADQTPFFDI